MTQCSIKRDECTGKPCEEKAVCRTTIDPDNKMKSVHDSYEFLCSYHKDHYWPHLLVSGFNVVDACKACGDADCEGDCEGGLILHHAVQQGED